MIERLRDKDKLVKSLDRFGSARVLVVGDIILDEYIWGSVSRISPEAPVPVVEVRKQTQMLGGAGNVVSNLVSLGAKPMLCGVVGDDQPGSMVLSKIKNMGLETDAIFIDKQRPTSVKTRVIAHSQQVVRFDRESKAPISRKILDQILERASSYLKSAHVIIVSDYGKGVISRELIEHLQALGGESEIPIIVDPKIGNFSYYKGVDILTPNNDEASSYCRFIIDDDKSLVNAGHMLLDELQCGAVLITRGKYGMSLFEKDGSVTHIPAVAKEVYDVTGAGDTVVATLALGIAAGLDLPSSSIMANFAGGIVVGKVGTSTVSPSELKAAIFSYVVTEN